jgi:hypothetical protein
MSAIAFPGLDEFHRNFCAAVTGSGKEQEFTKKWGLNRLTDIHPLLSNNIQGGYQSHRRTMLSASMGGSVLNIGPGMGFCVFLLTELFDPVYVAEPDPENCLLLQGMARHYRTRSGKPASEIVKILQAGLSITTEAVDYWNMKRLLMEKRKLKGSILNFTIQGAAELKEVLTEKVDRVYLHKVLSSLSISNGFEQVIAQCRQFLTDQGVITWAEPGYVFAEILQLENHHQLEKILTPIFFKNRLHYSLENYPLINTDKSTQRQTTETWTLIKATLTEKGSQ